MEPSPYVLWGGVCIGLVLIVLLGAFARLFAARRRVTALERRGDIAGLRALCTGAPSLVDRVPAARALGRLGTDEALEALAQAYLKEKEPASRQVILGLLTASGQGLVGPLLRSWKRLSSEERATAVEELKGLGAETLADQFQRLAADRPELLTVLWDQSDGELRQSALEAVLSQEGEAIVPFLGAWSKLQPHERAAGEERIVAIGEPAAGALAGALEDRNREVRSLAVRGLSRIGGTRATEALIAAMNSSHSDVRAAAVESLALSSSERAREALVSKAWRDETALLALASLDAPVRGTIEAILLGSDVPSVRRSAAGILREIGNPQAARSLIAALADEDAEVRAEAADALGHLGNRACAESLIPALKDKDSRVRVKAATALGQIGPPGVGSLIEVLDDTLVVRMAAAFALQALYRSGRLSGEDRQQILEQKDRLASLHTDRAQSRHEDDPWGAGKYPSDCTHLDKTFRDHTDLGARVEL